MFGALTRRSNIIKKFSLFSRPHQISNFLTSGFNQGRGSNRALLSNGRTFPQDTNVPPHKSIETITIGQATDNLKKVFTEDITDMGPPKVLFKILNPESKWDKVPLAKVKDVMDLKEAIKNRASRTLNAYDPSNLILTATKKIDDANQGMNLDERKNLASVLKDFQVEIPATEDVAKIFADNIWLFVNYPTVPALKRKLDLQVLPHKRRRFAAGTEAYPIFNFFIEPKVLNVFGSNLLQRQYCLLLGHRQSGKTTICQALLRWFDEHPEKFTELVGGNRDDFDIYVATFDSTVTADQGPKVFWETVCKYFNSLDPRFELKDTAMDSATFKKFFSKRYNPSSKPVILIIDEASRLTSVGGTISEAAKEATDQFISVLRALKNANDFLLHSVALVGTESIRELLMPYNKPGASSQVSPFTAGATWMAGRFTKTEVKDLFDQFASDISTNFESANISADIFELTLGHKGLVGSCGTYIQKTFDYTGPPIKTGDDWKKITTFELQEKILETRHCRSIMRSLNFLTPECRFILTAVLRHGTHEVNVEDDATKYLIAEGLVSIKNKVDIDRAILECSAPILRSLILSKITIPTIRLSQKVPDGNKLDPRWLLARTIEHLCLRHLYAPKSLNADKNPSEYTFQSEFSTILRNLIPLAYPLLRYKTLVEVKESQKPDDSNNTLGIKKSDESDDRRQRLNILIRNGENTPSYGYELVVAGSKKEFDEHCVRAEEYKKLHNCEMFMVNLYPKKTLCRYFGERSYNVTPVNVVIDYNESKESKGTIIYEKKDEPVLINSSDWNMVFDSNQGKTQCM